MNRRQRRAVWVAVLFFAALLTLCTIGTVSYFIHESDARNERIHDACISRQDLYDGQLVMVHFLAGQFHATPAQEAAGTAVLRKTLGPRPECN